MIDVATSWVRVAPDSEFPLENLPYGVFAAGNGEPHIGVAIGDAIFDLHAASKTSLFDGTVSKAVLQAPTLNLLLAAGRQAWSTLRTRVRDLLLNGTAAFGDIDREQLLVRRDVVRMLLPFAVGDYVDFYSSLEHATNLGKIFRPSGEPLMPNWRWIPIGYHGRSSTIVIDGTPVVRPKGQRKPPDAAEPSFGPSRLLDIELEVGFVTGPGNTMGHAIPIEGVRDHLFGLVLVNDWSARDIQAWEYQPLGPFLGKSFATSISPWVVTLDALEPYRIAGPEQVPQPLPYLRTPEAWNYDVQLVVELQTQKMRERGMAAEIISRSNFKYMYWNMAQQLAHTTVNGTAVRPGDLYASGTISGPTPDSYGSFIELTWRGSKPLRLQSGEERAFLEDGDTVTLRGVCEAPGKPRIGFGAVSGTIIPAT
ncbi:MAG TPA: fumarylacetoacetase [Candidatus Baltobacteraceae bacterium]|nr:fumarylacetoacetase [Candidatus Baltobacteraceae bacterium]